MEQFTILPWESRALLAEGTAILKLPYAPITPDLRKEVNSLYPLAIIPPYDPGNWKFIAQSAVTTRGHFPDQRVMVALPGGNRHETRRHMSGFQADGFDAFAIPELMEGVPVAHAACFWESSQILISRVWYHIAGGKGIGPIADVKGFWSWSLEEL